MNQQQFHDLLLQIKDCKDNIQRNNIEAQYVAFRDLNPSDNFIQLILNEIITDSPVQEHAVVLLNQDLQKNDKQSAIFRLSNSEYVKQIMNQLLQYVAQKPNNKICKFLATYFHYELFEDRVFKELEQFIQQGCQQQNIEVKRMCANTLQRICQTSYTNLMKLEINVLEILNVLIQDQDSEVAMHAVQAIGNIIVNNDFIEEEKPALDQNSITQMVNSQINRIAQHLQQNGDNVILQKMIQFIVSEIDIQPDQIEPCANNLIQFIVQIFQSNLDENVKREVVNMYCCIVQNFDAVKKQQSEQLQTILSNFIIPNSVIPENIIDDWLNSPKDYEYETDSLFDACANCIKTAAYSLGRQVVYPVLHNYCQQVMQNQDYKLWIATLITLESAGEGMYDVCKQKDVEMFTQVIIKGMQHQHPRVRYNALITIGRLSSVLCPKIQKYHKQLIPAISALMNDPCQKVTVHSSTAMVHFLEKLDYQQVYEHFDTFLQMIKCSWQGTIWMQSNALILLGSLCQIVDEDDIVPFLSEVGPSIFQQFDSVMAAVQQTPVFEYEQTVYIKSLLEMISNAVKCSPDLFKEYIDQIMGNITVICQRGLQNSETDLLSSAMDAMNVLTEDFAEQQEKYIIILYDSLMSILELSNVDTGKTLETEAHENFNEDTVQLQSDVLVFLADFMKFNQKCLSVKLNDMLHKFNKFQPYGTPQTIHLLTCYSELLHVATATQPFEIAEQVKNLVLQLMIHNFSMSDTEVDEKNLIDLKITCLENMMDADDIFSDFIKYYIEYALKFGDQQLEQIINKFITHLHDHVDKANLLLTQNMAEVDKSEQGADEKQALITGIEENYQGAMESVGMCYQQILINLKTQIPSAILQQIGTVAIQLLRSGAECKTAVLSTIEGISLFADFAQHFDQQIVLQLFSNEAIQLFINYIVNNQEEYNLIRNIFYTLYEYLKKTHHYEIASNGQLLQLSIQLIDQFKLDGSEDALGAYDNVCSFLQQSGVVCNQPAEYWDSLLSYCNYMEQDDSEVANTLNFFVHQLNNAQVFIQSKELTQNTNKLIATLFYGKFYSELLKDDLLDQATLIHIQNNVKWYQQYVATGNSFMKKNYQNYINRK